MPVLCHNLEPLKTQFDSRGVCLFQLVAVFDDGQRGRADSPGESLSNGYSSSAPSHSPELQYFPHLEYKEPIRGEIEVNEASLKASKSDGAQMANNWSRF